MCLNFTATERLDRLVSISASYSGGSRFKPRSSGLLLPVVLWLYTIALEDHTTFVFTNIFHFSPEDGGNMFFWNVGVQPKDYTAQQPRRR
jgi:hypothetical protein